MATKELTSGDAKNTVIGPSILISGKLTGDEDLTVQGRVEGELTLTRTLIVEVAGVVKANVAVRNAIVSGVVVGNINATESVELTREGRMVGDIRAPRVIIVDGASFRGRVDMGEVEPGRVPDRQIPRPNVRPGTTSARPSLPSRPAALTSRPTASAPQARPAAKPMPPPPASKPVPPPPPKAESKPSESKAESKPESGPPTPPVVAAGGKKKVIIKKKAR
ncbi:MAG TPA: polymer-forming cytoskeletal protein [Myxococcaceae bacterium]|nr:polymer-forming cytoskeletal protein [Myxococcaceae bacterium]